MTKPHPTLFYLLACASIFIIVSLACNLPTSSEESLSLNPRAPDGSISGSYRSSSGPEVEFTVTSDGFATFQAADAPESERLSISLTNERTALLDWKGMTFDGFGSLTGEERAALDDLMTNDLATSLEMIPMDIACEGKEEAGPKQVAALLVPLQMRFKYLVADRSAEAERLAALSQCGYGTSDAGEDQRGDSSIILLSRAAPIPVVLGYFPFDAEGAVEPQASSVRREEFACLETSPSITLDGLTVFNLFERGPELMPGLRINEEGPCEARCRGACGPDCELNNCSREIEPRCEKDENGNNTGMLVHYIIYDCGLHQGCIDHDNCYDDCNSTYGCGTWEAAFCRHGWTIDALLLSLHPNWWCDQKAIAEHGPIYPPLWMEGYGPQPMRETYEYLYDLIDEDYGVRKDLERCPVEEPVLLTPEEDSIEIHSGTYIGTSTYPQVISGIFTPGQFTTNEVLINISEDGSVSGSLTIFYTGDTFIREDNNCAMYWEGEIQGSFSGQIIGNTGTIDLTEHWECVLIADCSDTGECDAEPVIRQIDVVISGDQLTGQTRTLPNPEFGEELFNWTFTASKQ